MTETIVSAGGAPFVQIRHGSGPFAAVALHSGHALRPGLESHLALSDAERLREEDPHTATMAPEGITLVNVLRSRFEVDCNRPRFRAVYQGPKDSWGLKVYRTELPDAEDRVSRAVYDAFYASMFDEFSRLAEQHRRFVVFDIHSYNHRREGPGSPAAVDSNPEVNLGTGRLDRARWAPVVDTFVDGMSSAGFEVGENVKFSGGHFAHWIAEMFPDAACTLAIEFKKTYMDEWTGDVDLSHVARIRTTLTSLLEPLAGTLAEVR